MGQRASLCLSRPAVKQTPICAQSVEGSIVTVQLKQCYSILNAVSLEEENGSNWWTVKHCSYSCSFFYSFHIPWWLLHRIHYDSAAFPASLATSRQKTSAFSFTLNRIKSQTITPRSPCTVVWAKRRITASLIRLAEGKYQTIAQRGRMKEWPNRPSGTKMKYHDLLQGSERRLRQRHAGRALVQRAVVLSPRPPAERSH